jgi:glyoxylase-like metal-dependent hydrolase (beta-lactamase superfamily II)
MTTKTINENLIQLTRLHFVNAFLVREDDGFTLVDTTVGGGAGELIDAAESAGGSIRRIVLTHGHGDHVGSLDDLMQQLGGSVEVHFPELDARIHAGEKVVEGKLPGGWPQLQTVPDARLSGGERIGSLEVIPTPGHTPGHVSYLDTRDKTAITGDLFTSYGRVEVSNHFYWRFPLAAMATWDGTKDLESARRLLELAPSTLVVGHGPPTPNPRSAMARAIDRATR